ncbi:MAG: hypothetical protein CM15mP106_4140 [Candidatus Neomarinimicrobiota bacterium]|nr:MAG: hypothetical protein CM15mP106_4140 [Candidatus Neomarinimicrobiota bacterium]
MTDHEYGALVRAWNAWGKKAKVHIKYANVTLPLESKISSSRIFQAGFHQKQKSYFFLKLRVQLV